MASDSLYALAALTLLALLTGCGTVREVVRVPVPVPCVVDLPAEPRIATDLELRAMSDYRLVLVIARERLQLLGYSGELRAAAAGCLPKLGLEPVPMLDQTFPPHGAGVVLGSEKKPRP